MENKYKLSFCNALSAIKMTQHAKKQENMIHNQVKNQSEQSRNNTDDRF